MNTMNEGRWEKDKRVRSKLRMGEKREMKKKWLWLYNGEE